MNNNLEEAIVNGFKKFDAGKPDWSLMPEEALEEVLNVLMSGKRKYSGWNWLDNADGVRLTRYYNALERHLKAAKRGQDLDPETNLLHLAHMACNCLFLITLHKRNLGVDDRRKDLKMSKFFKPDDFPGVSSFFKRQFSNMANKKLEEVISLPKEVSSGTLVYTKHPAPGRLQVYSEVRTASDTHSAYLSNWKALKTCDHSTHVKRVRRRGIVRYVCGTCNAELIPTWSKK